MLHPSCCCCDHGQWEVASLSLLPWLWTQALQRDGSQWYKAQAERQLFHALASREDTRISLYWEAGNMFPSTELSHKQWKCEVWCLWTKVSNLHSLVLKLRKWTGVWEASDPTSSSKGSPWVLVCPPPVQTTADSHVRVAQLQWHLLFPEHFSSTSSLAFRWATGTVMRWTLWWHSKIGFLRFC